MTLLLDSPSGNPSVDGAATWKFQYGLERVYVVSDHDASGNAMFSMVPGTTVGTPQITVIDPRTMTVVALQEGFSGTEPAALVNLAAQNAATKPQHPTAPPQQ